MTNRHQLSAAFDALLQPALFKDYCPNGLQVEGGLEVQKIVSGVTASLALIEAAVAAKADTIFVHHGLIWKGQDGRVTGWIRQRLGLLLEHNINLFAYHLPLDAHAELGNNAQLGVRLGLQVQDKFGEQGLGCIGTRVGERPFSSAQELANTAKLLLGREVLLVPGRAGPVSRIAWCTGGAQSYFEGAISAGADVFLTGEISEPQAHYARESGVSFIACGHHATERYGAAAVAARVAQQMGLQHMFIDVDNPA
jgi:dinuclear metal center YbgI/SA1388 family protein